MSASTGGNGFRGVIFDLDGTLIDSYDAIAASLNHALTSLGEPAKSWNISAGVRAAPQTPGIPVR